MLSGRISAFQGVKWTYLSEILDTSEVIFQGPSDASPVLAQGLQPRVSVVRFRPWPPRPQRSSAVSRPLLCACRCAKGRMRYGSATNPSLCHRRLERQVFMSLKGTTALVGLAQNPR